MTAWAACQQDIAKIKYPPPQYIMCEDFDFGWPIRHLSQFKQDWKQGLSLEKMAEKYNRRWEEVFMLIVDHLERGWIDNRPGGIYGGRGVT